MHRARKMVRRLNFYLVLEIQQGRIKCDQLNPLLLSFRHIFSSPGDGDRTRTPVRLRILSPLRLPISPPPEYQFRNLGFKPYGSYIPVAVAASTYRASLIGRNSGGGDFILASQASREPYQVAVRKPSGAVSSSINHSTYQPQLPKQSVTWISSEKSFTFDIVVSFFDMKSIPLPTFASNV